MSREGRYRIDVRAVRRAFDRACRSYDAAAVVQQEARNTLLERLELVALEPKVVLDAGAGTGHASRALQRRYPKALVIAADFSVGMLRIAGRQRRWLHPFERLCADVTALPLADASVDLVFGNFLLPWCELPAVLGEFRRVLAPRGLLTFTSLGPDTLKELRAAWADVDGHDRVGAFIDMHDVGDGLVQAGLTAPVLDLEYYTLQYPDLAGLATDLRGAGSRNPFAGRPKGLTSPRRLSAMREAYERFRRDGRLPATYEVIFGQAWAPADAPTASDVAIPLQEMRRELAARRSRQN